MVRTMRFLDRFKVILLDIAILRMAQLRTAVRITPPFLEDPLAAALGEQRPGVFKGSKPRVEAGVPSTSARPRVARPARSITSTT